jgi:hypothetical protein
MPAKKLKPLTPEEQRALFMEAAKKAEADESGKQFEKAFKKIITGQSKAMTHPARSRRNVPPASS